MLRCLVVDCGGVTHPDSGLKEAVRSLRGDAAGKAAKAQWAAFRDDCGASKISFWEACRAACGLSELEAMELDQEICGNLRGSGLK